MSPSLRGVHNDHEVKKLCPTVIKDNVFQNHRQGFFHKIVYQTLKVFMLMDFRNIQPQIGQAWTGKHVLLLQCTIDNQFIALYKSYHAPTEPPRSNCAETLSQLLSIGYQIHAVTAISPNLIQYTLVL